jgi:tetratricopeptide (TPR) repeat protein
MRLLIRQFRRALAALHLARARRHFERGNFERAAARLRSAIALDPTTFEGHFTLGQIYLRTFNFERARREFALARELDPGRFAARGWQEHTLLRLALHQEAAGREFGSASPDRDAAAVARESSQESLRENGDDFVSPAERERFRILPPIGADDIDRVDWSRARDLFD